MNRTLRLLLLISLPFGIFMNVLCAIFSDSLAQQITYAVYCAVFVYAFIDFKQS